MSTLQDLYIDQLHDLYDAEQQITDALPKMARHATSSSLRAGFEEHLKETKEQIQRLDQIFKGLGIDSGSEKCEAMRGIIKEGEELMGKDAAQEVLEAGLIASAQRVEHYEIAAYGTVRTLARQLGRDDDAELLSKTLSEEKETDSKLTTMAEHSINQKAVSK
jgi:ferritin-like metal-binding protein YciE